MSYDVCIGEYSFNYTFNLSKLFYDHIPAEQGEGGIRELHGMTGKQALVVLAAAFDRIAVSLRKDGDPLGGVIGEPVFCSRYDAKNGWGSTVGALVFLANVMAACALNKRKKVHICA